MPAWLAALRYFVPWFSGRTASQDQVEQRPDLRLVHRLVSCDGAEWVTRPISERWGNQIEELLDRSAVAAATNTSRVSAAGSAATDRWL